jgi:flagellar hook-length control protein FliK
MITVTSTPSAINTLTPVTDGVANSGTSTPNEGFTSALSAQLGLAAPAVDENGAPVLAQAALLANATENAPITTLSTQQPAALINTQIETPLVLNLPTDLPATALSAQDEAILSNVNDTLKFITAGSKLGDTLAQGQTVQLQNANVSTPITQQTIQSAVNQAAINQQVNTPAAVLAQQAMPVQVGEAFVETPQSELGSTVVLSQIQYAATENTEQPILTTPAQVQTPVAQAENPIVTTQAQIQTAVAQTQVKTAENPVVTTQAQIQTTVAQAQVETHEKPVVITSAQVQTPIAQIETAEKPTVTISAEVQTTAAQIATAEKPAVTTATQVQTPVAQIATAEKPAVTTATQVQTSVAQVEKAEKPAVTTATQVQTPVTQIAMAEKPAVTITAQIQTPVAQVEKTVLITPVQNVIVEKVAKKADENTQITEPVLLAEITAQTVTQNVVVEENIDGQAVAQSETQKTENQDAQTTQVVEQMIAPIVTAQATPIQVEAESATFETTTAPEDKPTLTPAKNLLADVLANRSNGSDTAANGGDKKGSDNSANPTLQADNSLKAGAENRQITDAKPFASLLAAEKSDVTTATLTTSASTVEKSAPQVMAAVNKLADSVKPEVPALTRPLSHPSWNQDMGERIVWMNNRGISSAEIRMNPQNMGPITVRIDMNQDQATIAFTAQNVEVRTALEASIPKLREMLSSQNVNLADVNVSQQSSTSADSGRSQQQAAQMAADASANGQGGNRQNQEVDANGNPVHSANANGEEIAVDEFANGQVLQDNGSNGLLSIFA